MSHESSREAYAREHGLSAPDMQARVDRLRFAAEVYFVHKETLARMWDPEPVRIMGEGFNIDFDYLPCRELTTYEEVQAALLQGYTVQLSSRKRTLPPTSYFYERAMERSQELKQGKDPEGFYK